MTRIILTLLIIFSFSMSANAQTYFGFKVGGNFANFAGDVENNAIKPSFHFGGVAEITLSDFFSVQPELLFSMQGFQNKDDANLKYHYHYINAPIMAKYFFNKYFSVDAGPQVGILVFAKSTTGDEEFTDLKDFANSFDYGFNLGGSYEMENGMNINVRYYYGLADVLKEQDGVDLKANNTVIQISLGYKFY